MDVHVQVADFHVSFQDLCPRFYHDPWLGSFYCGEHKPLTYFVPIQTPKPCWFVEDSCVDYINHRALPFKHVIDDNSGLEPKHIQTPN